MRTPLPSTQREEKSKREISAVVYLGGWAEGNPNEGAAIVGFVPTLFTVYGSYICKTVSMASNAMFHCAVLCLYILSYDCPPPPPTPQAISLIRG